MYYSYILAEREDPIDPAESDALVRTLLGPLAGSDTDISNAEELLSDLSQVVSTLEEVGEMVVGDINATPGVDAGDVQILYFASEFRSLLGNGTDGGFAEYRELLLAEPSGLDEPTDDQLKEILRKANAVLGRSN